MAMTRVLKMIEQYLDRFLSVQLNVPDYDWRV
jgi:hypothetical protein